MKLLKQLRWYIEKSKLESNLARYCELEYRRADQSWALAVIMTEYKANYFGKR